MRAFKQTLQLVAKLTSHVRENDSATSLQASWKTWRRERWDAESAVPAVLLPDVHFKTPFLPACPQHKFLYIWDHGEVQCQTKQCVQGQTSWSQSVCKEDTFREFSWSVRQHYYVLIALSSSKEWLLPSHGRFYHKFNSLLKKNITGNFSIYFLTAQITPRHTIKISSSFSSWELMLQLSHS